VKTIAFFNNKGGVGKTSLIYHVGWMMSRMGQTVLLVDLDPQSNLTSMCLAEEELEAIWPPSGPHQSILAAIDPLLERSGDIAPAPLYRVTERLHLIPGDLGLSMFEDRLSEAWARCVHDNIVERNDAMRVTTAYARVASAAAAKVAAGIILIDVGPNVGAMNRAALIAADAVVIPLGADLFSLQALRNLGPTLKHWQTGWRSRLYGPTSVAPLPGGEMRPLGYVLLNPSVRENRPVRAYQRWVERIPQAYAEHIVRQTSTAPSPSDTDDCLGMIKHFKSLMPMAQDARKPMFALTPADGAIGGHAAAVRDCADQFERLARKILDRADLSA